MFFTGDTGVFGIVNPVFLTGDGVHLNHFGQYKFFRSLRGTVLQCLRSLQDSGQSCFIGSI